MKRLLSKPYFPIIIAPLILFSPLILSGKALFWGTSSTQFVPWWDFAWDTILQGQIPLWNPWVGMGAPLVANYQSAIFYPPYWFLLIVYAAAGLKWMSWSITFVVVFHLIWSGLGVARLLDELELGKLAQTVGGLAFSLSGYLVARAGFLSINAAVAWLPWILLYGLRVTKKGKKSTLMLGLNLALLLLAGHAQSAWYSILLGFVWIIFWSIKNSNASNWIRATWQSVGRFLAAGTLATGISAIQLIPTMEYLLQSQRASEYGFGEAMTYSFWPWRFLTIIVPGLFGNPAGGNYWGYGNYWEDAVYIGILPVLIGLGVLIRELVNKKKKQLEDISGNNRALILFLVSIIVISFWLALGDNTFLFPFLYKYVPTFGLFQAPTRLSIWAELALAILAAIGVDQLKRPEGKRKYWIRLAAAGCVAVIGGSLLGWFVLADVKSTFFVPIGWAGFLGLATALLILYIPRKDQELKYKIWSALVVVLVVVDLLAAGWGLNPGIKSNFYERSTGKDNQERFYIPADLEYDLKFTKYFRFDTFQPEADWNDMHQDFLPNLPVIQRLKMVNNFDPLVPARFQTWLEEYDRIDNQGQHQMSGLMNIGSIVTGDGGTTQQSELSFNEGFNEVRLNNLAMVSGDDDDVLSLLVSEAMDFRKNMILSTTTKFYDTECADYGNGEVRVIDQAPGYLKIETELDKNSWIVWSQSWYPGWISVIDGKKENKVERANYLFQAVCIPAGSHSVELIYRPVSFYAGAGITLVSLCGAAWFAVWGKKKLPSKN